jgi:hypothetical protein
MRDLNKKKYAVQICFISLFVFCGLLLGIRVSASEVIVYEQPQNPIAYSGCGQTFLATTSNISSISTILSSGLSTTTVIFRLCFGSWDTATSVPVNVQCKGDSQIVKSQQTFISPPTTFNVWRNWNIPDVSVASGTTYYFTMALEDNTNFPCRGSGINPYPYGQYWGSTIPSNIDFAFRIYYETDFIPPPELPPDYYFDGQPQYGPDKTLLKWRSDINTVAYQICFINEPCNLWFSFNVQAINNIVNLVYMDIVPQDERSSIATTTITATPVWQLKINVPIMTTEGARRYCLYMRDAEFGNYLDCGIQINWVSDDTFHDILGIASSTLVNVCLEVASSSGGFDDFRYGIECGLRKLIFWAFSPDDYAITYFLDDYNLLKRAFPFSIFFSLTDTAKNAIATTTLSQNDNLGLPFIRKTATSSQFYILPVISSSSLANAIGQTNAGIFRTTLSYFIYIMTASIIFLIII